ncbi:hypothetical protein BE221DRAFT_195348, partial [Ostreococcus tauri]
RASERATSSKETSTRVAEPSASGDAATRKALEECEGERVRLVEELEEMREQLRASTASAHRANAETNAMAHQSRGAVERERKRADAAEARVRALELAAAEMQVDREDTCRQAEDEAKRRAKELEDALETAATEIEALKSTNEVLSERVNALTERLETRGGDGMDQPETSKRSYADEAVVELRRAALGAKALANAYHARLFPEGDPERGKGRVLIIVHASLEGHPYLSASRDVTEAVRARVRAHDGKRLVILVSEDISELVPDEATTLETRFETREVQETRRPAILRVTYAFDAMDDATGIAIKGDERSVEIPIGAAGTPHAFAMQSLWIESVPSSVEDALKAAYARLRDAETTASSAKVKAIELYGQILRDRQRAGSSARARSLERRELELEQREAQLAAEVAEIEIAVTRAREEAEAVRRESHRLVADANAQIRAKDDEIERLRAVETSSRRARVRSKSWQLSESNRPDRRSSPAKTLASAEARLARITARARSVADAA